MSLRLAALPAVLGLCVLAMPSWPAAQSRFTSGRAVVRIFATVTDASGRRIKGLERDQFEVREDGVTREIVSFSNELQPLTAALVLDLSASMSLHADAVLTGARSAVQTLKPGDRMSVTPLKTRPTFSADHGILERSISGVTVGGMSPIWDSMRVNTGALLREPEPRLLVVFTDGGESVYQRPLNVLSDYYLPNVIADEIRKAGVPMVVVGTPKLDEWFEGAARRADALILKPETPAALAAAFPDIIEQAQSAYLLGILASEDGREHRLNVKVTLRDAKVRARSSYVAGPKLPSP